MDRAERYHERESQIPPDHRRKNWFCVSCRKTAKVLDSVSCGGEYPRKCAHCGKHAVRKLGTKSIVPRACASKAKWKAFYRRNHLMEYFEEES